MASNIQQGCLSAVAQSDDVNPLRDGEQDVPHVDALARAVARAMGRMVALVDVRRGLGFRDLDGQLADLSIEHEDALAAVRAQVRRLGLGRAGAGRRRERGRDRT